MPLEIEVKCPLPKGFTQLRKKLKKLGAKFEGLDHEHNTRLEGAGGSLMKKKRALRVRDLGDKCLVTLKEKRASRHAKVREEIQFESENAKTVLALLEKLGYRPIWIYEKVRENWHLGNCHICLDKLPHLGNYAEIEGPSEKAVLAFARKLELPKEKFTTQAYPDLVKKKFGRIRNLIF